MEPKDQIPLDSRPTTKTNPGKPAQTTKRADPARSADHPGQTSEVPLGSGTRAESPGAGGRPSQRVEPAGKRREKPAHR